jgi:hypothetical protein
VRVLFMPGRTLWRSRTCAQAHTWRLGAGFLNAGPEDFDDLSRAISTGRGAHGVPFADSPDFAELEQELDALVCNEQHITKGRAYDLDEIFARVDAEMFGGALERPRLTWGTSATRTRFGAYDRVCDLVTLSPVLDDPSLPACVPAFVLYHELLHKKHGFARAGSRRLAHTEAFMDDERRFPERERANTHLDAIALGDVPPRQGSPAGSEVPGEYAPPRQVSSVVTSPPPASDCVGTSARGAPRSLRSASAPFESRPPHADPLVVRSDVAARPAGAQVRVGRNAPCPCGSGRKYKTCCGRGR